MLEYTVKIPKILLVDDNKQNLVLIRKILMPLKVDFYIATSGNEALSRVENNDFDLILLDIIMPDIDGYTICKSLKTHPKKRDIPVLFMSALYTHENKIKGFESGADDYLVKPLYAPEVLARVQVHLHKHRILKQLKQLLKHSFHELYNPLSVIKTSAEMYGLQFPQNRYVDTMHAAAKDLEIIYEDIYYAISPKKREVCVEAIDMYYFIINRITYFDLLAAVKQIRIILSENHIHPVITFSISDLQRIVDNTLSNAIKYADESSIVSIKLEDNPLRLSIMNYGMTINHPEQIFSEGYREAYEKNGMGIGLEIVAAICHRNNIHIHVDSTNKQTKLLCTVKVSISTLSDMPMISLSLVRTQNCYACFKQR